MRSLNFKTGIAFGYSRYGNLLETVYGTTTTEILGMQKSHRPSGGNRKADKKAFFIILPIAPSRSSLSFLHPWVFGFVDGGILLYDPFTSRIASYKEPQSFMQYTVTLFIEHPDKSNHHDYERKKNSVLRSLTTMDIDWEK
uniref:Uncharacterized protein n=1 Tax=Megaselia scalaris TaxID=36166 RepID=T1GDK8_MEGSC